MTSKRIAVFGGSFNPPGLYHQRIVTALAPKFDVVKIIPCGPRPDKPVTNDIEPIHRAVMADLTFGCVAPNVEVELFDLENGTFTRNHELEARYASDGEVWHVVGTDLIGGGGSGTSRIQQIWAQGPEIWRRANFVVTLRRGTTFDPTDLPPRHMLLRGGRSGSSEDIRSRSFKRQSIKGLVTPEVEAYIERHSLYRGRGDLKQMELRLAAPQLLVVADPRNPEALALKERLSGLIDEAEPNLIVAIGGDGTMLHIIRDHWRRRLPFLGINTGHFGFLLNDVKSEVSAEFFGRDFIVRRSPLLYVETMDREGIRRSTLAFNDAWLQARPGSVGWFEVRIDGEVRIPHLVGDGVLVATAAGSTASARAMGANPIPVGTDLLIVVGSNVTQPLNWRNGANLPIDSVVEFRNTDPSGWRAAYGFADGINLGEIIEMKVRVSRTAAAEVVFTPDHDLRKKLALTQFPM